MAPHFIYENDPTEKERLPGTRTNLSHGTDDPILAEPMHKWAKIIAKETRRVIIEVPDNKGEICSRLPHRYALS